MSTSRQVVGAADRHHEWRPALGSAKDKTMRNPWTTKNPFMSMWLSSANRVASSARGQAAAAVKRQTKTVQAEAAKQMVDFWTGKAASAPARKTRKKTR
jgi:hypothetical protein